MPFHYEATSDFNNSLSEVTILLDLSSSDEIHREMFMKLALVSLVTKFQVFVEKILEEFRYNLNDTPSKKIPTHMKMNSLRLSMDAGNPLTKILKHKNFTEDKKNIIVHYLKSISFLSDDEYLINDEFMFNTKFPLGKTGKTELIDLLKQIDGEDNPFAEFGEEKLAKLDSVLLNRHSIIHQDRFLGTDNTVQEALSFLKDLVDYIDNYLYQKLEIIDNT